MILNALVEKLKRRSKDDFKGRHFEATLILQAVSWYLRYPLSYRDIEELFLERGLEVDHSTLNRWVLAYAPLIERRLQTSASHTAVQSGSMKRTSRSAASGAICTGPSTSTAPQSTSSSRRSATWTRLNASSARRCKTSRCPPPDPHRHRWCGVLSARHRGSPERWAPGAYPGALRDQAPAAGDRE